ncbi:unnamed protein product [Soboliphyme baturini]|uniref:TPR_REGION domain-containing protein n=1 Tax=Soboliphyme baturini TaxID=241478 RepID=A0A183JAH9_9BILA|nr:unnamed protein product [Soboliphyme baturini]
MQLLDKAVSIVPNNPLCRFHKAKLLVMQERFTEALAELNRLKVMVPKEPMVYFLTGKVKFILRRGLYVQCITGV